MTFCSSSTCSGRAEPQFLPGENSSEIPLLPASAPALDHDTIKRSPDRTWRGLSWRKLTHAQQNWLADWRLGLFIGCGASGLVLIINIAILLVGVFRYGGFRNGIGTLAQGRSASISRMSTAYHVLINISSTILLTSSNYCMQVLCSPTRDEVDLAHRHGRWLNIGVLSTHNLRYISARRVFLWWTLGLSSVPLHLLYVSPKNGTYINLLTYYSFNSAIFEVTIGRDYYVHFVAASDSILMNNLTSTAINLTNNDWKQTYDTQFVPNVGNAHLVVDKVSFGFDLHRNLTWDHFVPNSKLLGSDWSAAAWDELNNSTIDATVSLNTNGSFKILGANSYRAVYDISTYSQSQGSLPSMIWPTSTLVNASQTYSILNVPSISGINDTTFWLATAPLHIAYALVEPITDSSSVQIGLSFMIVVIISNVAKFMAILFTLRDFSSSLLLTAGDALASFLKRPDLTTVGMCNLKRQEIINRLRRPQNVESAIWRSRRLFIIAAISPNELAILSITL
jgi:hypothetical protein